MDVRETGLHPIGYSLGLCPGTKIITNGADIQQKVARLDGIERDVAELKQDMKVVKAAVVDLSRDLTEHKHLSAHVAHGYA